MRSVRVCMAVLGLFALGLAPLGAQTETGPDAPPSAQPAQPPRPQQASQQRQREVYERWLSPGAVASVYSPFGNDKVYAGAGFHYILYQLMMEARNPSDWGGFLQLQAEIMYYKELDTPWNTDIFFTYTGGLSLSFEKFISGHRSGLVPTFGIQAGGIYINQEGANGLFILPHVGLMLFTNANISIGVDGRFYLNGVNLGDYIGAGLSITTSFSF